MKLHKDNYPLRPIVSAVNSTTYKTARFISTMLSPYIHTSPSFIENTRHFIEQIRRLHIEEDETLVSFDVKSLFTSAPTVDAMQTIKETLQADPMLESRIGISGDTLMSLIKLCLSTTHFKFRDKNYELTDGLPMGCPASPSIANMFMIKLEETALDTFTGRRPRIWLRYVDDIFSIIKKNLVKRLLEHLNSIHPSTQFTVEIETNGKLPFLDTAVHRNGTSLEIDVYRKPTHTGRYLHYESNHPDSAKRAVVRALLDRTEYITRSDPHAKRSEEDRVHQDLIANNYPPQFIRRSHRTRIRESGGESTRALTYNEGVKTTASIPYVRGLSETIGRILKPPGIRTVMRPTTLKWQLMKNAKDTTPKEETPGVIYALGCTDCAQLYIGETMRTAKQRMREHKYHTRSGHLDMSAIAKHTHEESHTMHWSARILAHESDKTKRKVKEALAIRTTEKKRGADKLMNQDKGLDVSKIWLDFFSVLSRTSLVMPPPPFEALTPST